MFSTFSFIFLLSLVMDQSQIFNNFMTLHYESNLCFNIKTFYSNKNNFYMKVFQLVSWLSNMKNLEAY